MEEKEDSKDKLFLNKKRNRSKDTEEHTTKSKKKRKNRKRLLKNKLEFFLSDLNLYHDEYLKKIYLSNNLSISPEILLSFNSIKSLLKGIEKDSDKKNIIIKAIEISHKLIYDKNTNQIKRKIPYQENLINKDLIDKSTIFVQNFPTIINHDIIYDLFKDYKILFIQLLKKKKNKYSGEALITFENEEDVNNVIEQFNNSIPKLISELNPKELKPLKIMTKENYLNNFNNIDNVNDNKKEIKDSNNINDNKNMKEKELNTNKFNDNIDENTLIKINHIKDNITLKIAKQFLYKIVTPLFIDINKKEKSMILRFDSKITSDLFLSKIKENNYDNIKDILDTSKDNDNNICVYELKDEERKDYLNNVKKKIEKYKENKDKEKKLKQNKGKIKSE